MQFDDFVLGCRSIRGVFDAAVAPDDTPDVSFHAAPAHTPDAAAFADVQARVRTRVLRTFVKRGLIDRADATAYCHDPDTLRDTVGVLLKYQEDVGNIPDGEVAQILEELRTATITR